MENLINFITSDFNSAYLYSIIIMIGIFLLELISILAGFHLSSLIDDAMPDFDADADIDADIDFDGISFHQAILHWFNVGQVPFLVLIIIFLTVFGLTGFAAQYISIKTISTHLSQYILLPVNIIFSSYILHKTGRFIGRMIPAEETTAVSQDSFIGKIAVITTGTSKKGMPAQAKIKDQFGRFHYIMTEPINEGDEFGKGVEVVVVDRVGRIFLIDAFEIN